MRLQWVIRCLVLSALVLVSGASAAAEAAGGPVWLDYEAGLSQAKKEHKYILVDFYTGWCRDCKNMDKTTFSDPSVIKRLKAEFVTVKVDGEKRKDLAAAYQVVGYPTLVALDKSGARATQRIGYMSGEELNCFLDYVKSGAYKTTSYRDYMKNRK
jgi:thioredoxin-related protein